MRGRFTTRELKDIGVAFAGDQSIHGGTGFLNASMLQSRCTPCVAKWALKIAVVGDLEYTDAGMLFMIAAKATIAWAAEVRFDKRSLRKFGRQSIVITIEPASIGANEIFPQAVSLASLSKIDTVASSDDLGRHDFQALGA